MSEDKLKPCPFCGEAVINLYARGNDAQASCASCGAKGPETAYLPCSDHWINAWNMREDEPVVVTGILPAEIGWYWFRCNDDDRWRVVNIWYNMYDQWLWVSGSGHGGDSDVGDDRDEMHLAVLVRDHSMAQWCKIQEPEVE